MCNIHCITILLVVVGCRAMYNVGSAVIELTPDTISQINNDSDLWLVEFYAPWCKYSIKFAPEYEKAAKALKSVVKVGAVDAEKYQDLGDKFKVEYFPILKMFIGPKQYDYKGPQKAVGLVEAVLKVVKRQVYSKMGMAPPAEDKTTDNMVEVNLLSGSGKRLEHIMKLTSLLIVLQ